ncbi:MAG: MbnP family protein [Panacibacter sp.]
MQLQQNNDAVQYGKIFLCARQLNRSEASLATLGSKFLFHGSKQLQFILSGAEESHSCTHANSIQQCEVLKQTSKYNTAFLLFNCCFIISRIFILPVNSCNDFFKNALQKRLTVFFAEYINFSTSVRRKERSVKDILLGTKNFYLKFTYKPSVTILLVLIFICNTATFAQQASSPKLIINFKSMAGDKLLQQDSVYTNAFGESFSVSTFKYYISNIVLLDASSGEKQFYKDQYFLIDEADSATKQIELTTTLNSISSLQFLLGVDSLKNVSGVQTGNLDPAKGMFWIWNSGYVMAKLEGNSPVAKTPQHAFSYHVGGYKKNEQTAKHIELALPQKLLLENAATQVTIQANVMAWFNAVNEIKITTSSFCHEPGTLAVKLADNYSKMFSVVQ